MMGISARKARSTDICEKHPQRNAVMRVFGIDTYSDEPVDCCQECFDEIKSSVEKKRETPCLCDWCNQTKLDVKPFKDREGSRDNVTNNVCPECRKAYIQKELTNVFIAGRRKTKTVSKQYADDELVSEESDVDNNDDDLLDDD